MFIKLFGFFIKIFISISIFFFNKKILKNKKIYIQNLNTYGDTLIFYNTIKNISKKNFIVVSPKTFLNESLLKIFFEKKNYIIFDQFIYLKIKKIIREIYLKVKNIEPYSGEINKYNTLEIEMDYYLCHKLRKYLNDNDQFNLQPLSLYEKQSNFNINKKKYKDNFSKLFINKFKEIKKIDNTYQFYLKYFSSRKKFNLAYSLKQKNSLLKSLNLLGKKFICLHIRPFKKKWYLFI